MCSEIVHQARLLVGPLKAEKKVSWRECKVKLTDSRLLHGLNQYDLFHPAYTALRHLRINPQI